MAESLVGRDVGGEKDSLRRERSDEEFFAKEVTRGRERDKRVGLS